MRVTGRGVITKCRKIMESYERSHWRLAEEGVRYVS